MKQPLLSSAWVRNLIFISHSLLQLPVVLSNWLNWRKNILYNSYYWGIIQLIYHYLTVPSKGSRKKLGFANETQLVFVWLWVNLHFEVFYASLQFNCVWIVCLIAHSAIHDVALILSLHFIYKCLVIKYLIKDQGFTAMKKHAYRRNDIKALMCAVI